MSCWRLIQSASSLIAMALILVSCSQPVSRDSDLSPNEASFSLDLEVTGEGGGEVRVVPPDVICRSDCIQSYSSPVSVTLTVTVEDESAIGSWGGACSSAGTTRQCMLRVDSPVTASLELTDVPQPDDGNGSPEPDEGQDENEDVGAEESDDRDDEERDGGEAGDTDTDPRGKPDHEREADGGNWDKGDKGKKIGNDDGTNGATVDEGNSNEEENDPLPQPVDADLTITLRSRN